MIDLTPLDVRKKRGDFRRILRGYDPEEVDHFLELVAERMEVLVRENFAGAERIARLQEQVGSLEGRERAVHEALVTAEKLRGDVKEQARREADVILREAEAEARRVREEGERELEDQGAALASLERDRRQFLMGFRALLERQMERLDAEEEALDADSGVLPPPRRTPRASGYLASRRSRGVAAAAPVAAALPLAGEEVPDASASLAAVEADPGEGSPARPEAERSTEPTDVPGAVSAGDDGDGVVSEATAVEVADPQEVASAVPEGDASPGDTAAVAEGEAPASQTGAPREGEQDEGQEGGDEAEVEDLSRWLASFLEDEGGSNR